MIGGLVVSLFLILYSSTSHSLPSAANTSNPTNHTSYSTAWNPYELQPPPPPIYHSPWLPPEGFYDHFDPWIADIVRNRVQDMLAEWRIRHLPPLYHCRYTCEQYIPPRLSPPPAHENPTPHDVQENPATTPPVHDNPTIPPPPSNSTDNCPTMERVMETCTSMRQHDTVNYAYSWSCTYSDECCKETLNVHDECLNLNPTISWLKSICCDSSTTPAGGDINA